MPGRRRNRGNKRRDNKATSSSSEAEETVREWSESTEGATFREAVENRVFHPEEERPVNGMRPFDWLDSGAVSERLTVTVLDSNGKPEKQGLFLPNRAFVIDFGYTLVSHLFEPYVGNLDHVKINLPGSSKRTTVRNDEQWAREIRKFQELPRYLQWKHIMVDLYLAKVERSTGVQWDFS